MNTSDPLNQVATGQERHITAARWNCFTEASRRVLRGDPGDHIPDIARGMFAQLVVTVRNDSGADRSRGDVLRITDSVTDPANIPYEVQRSPVLAGNTPNAVKNPFVILKDPIPNGKYGTAIIQGVAVCDVSVTDTTHEFAVPTASDATKLTSSPTGATRIFYKPSGTGTKRAVVMLAEYCRQFTFVRATGTPTSGFYPGLVLDYDGSTDTWSDTTQVVTLEPLADGTLDYTHTTARYLAFFSGTYRSGSPVYVALGDADQVGTDYFGGLLNTVAQIIKGQKTFRDPSFWKSEEVSGTYAKANGTPTLAQFYTTCPAGLSAASIYSIPDGGFVEVGAAAGSTKVYAGANSAGVLFIPAGGAYRNPRIGVNKVGIGQQTALCESRLHLVFDLDSVSHPSTFTLPYYGVQRADNAGNVTDWLGIDGDGLDVINARGGLVVGVGNPIGGLPPPPAPRG